jgi:hypothetical protein
MARSCPALISLMHQQHPRQHHWWLADDGFPQRIAGLLGAPLQQKGRAARELGMQASYRYLIQLHPGGGALSCWRRYPEGIGWQRRCGPLPLDQFVRRFSAGSRGASS